MFHTLKAIKDKIHRWKLPVEKKLLKDNWSFINYNVKLLHKSRTEEDFLELWTLIENNWKEKYPQNFLKYFRKKFIDNRKKLEWVRKELIGLNFTNNGLEKFHSDIKQTYTEKKKLPLNEFLLKCLRKILRDCSLDHQDTFALLPEFKTEVWRKALFMLKDQKRGPFLGLRTGFALFIKKKRKLEIYENRKK